MVNDYIVDCIHEVTGPLKAAGFPIELSQTPDEIGFASFELGQHTEKLLIEVGGYKLD